MLWLIWIVLMLLVPVGAGVHVWWQLHRAPHEGVATPQPAQLASQVVVSSTDGTQAH
jgi:hypothetical protein